MESYTHASDEGMRALIKKIKSDPEPYDMSLNTTDMIKFVRVLQLAEDVNAPRSQLGEWAGDMLSAVAETYGIEFI